MKFAWPHLLWGLLVPAALLAWDLTRQRRTRAATRPKILRAEAGAHSLRLSSSHMESAGPAVARGWLCLGLAFAVVALARPQWGRVEEPVFEQAREILIAVDLSRSMLAEDVKPSRLERSKLLIQSLLEKLAGERVGLAVFAGTAFLQSPLSADYEILREFLPALGPSFLPEGGSHYGALLDTAVDAFGSGNAADRFLIILSDGEATDEGWRSRIAQLKTKGIRVIGLGVGSASGAMIPDGSGGLVKDERGAVVLSKLESATLEALARETDGLYRDASRWVDLAALVRQTVEAGRKGEFVEKNQIRFVERFQWPLAFALWCLLVSLWYEFPVRPRVRDLKLAPAAGEAPPADRIRPADTPAAVKAGASLLLAALLGLPDAGFAAATHAPFPNGAPPAAGSAAQPAPPPEPPALSRLVGRLATADTRTARDWAELGRETVNWGSRLKSGQQPVPEGPVRDALAATELGAKLDPKATDWPKLREELEALLEKPEDEQKQPEQNQQQQDKNQQQQQQQNQKSGQKQQTDNAQQQEDKSKNDPSSSDSSDQQQPPSAKPDPGESPFKDLDQPSDKQEPPQPQPDTQKVGGAPEKKEQAPETQDPALALPLQKLEQLRNQDSPAVLFQLLEGDKKQPAKKSGKDW